jgi:peptide/nickel transport system permease protein
MTAAGPASTQPAPEITPLPLRPRKPEERAFVASQWQLVWWRFRKHKVALASMFVLAFLYSFALFSEFWAPYDPWESDPLKILNPPMPIHLFHEGRLRWPFVYGTVGTTDRTTYARVFVEDRTQLYPLKFFVRGWRYELWGLFEGDLHFFGTDAVDERGNPQKAFLLGADLMGRCMLARAITSARVSLSVGLVGVIVSLTLGVLIGGASGYFGGFVDIAIQRVIEFLRSIPRIPLWMSLSAALPLTWGPIQTYFAITVVLAIIGWTGLARVVRGRFLALREDDFVMAARLVGSSEWRVIVRHMVPSMTSHLIASLTLSVPGMILGETSLSFLGLGLRPPVVSWGVLLREGQSLSVMALSPWLAFVPAAFVLVTVLAFNFLGDGLRDAADPYGR